MAAISAKLKVVVVTPEKALLEQECDFVVLPMFDGEFGVLPGHAPFVGQLAPGELKIKDGSLENRYYIDGGFAQVRDNTVNVLTASALFAVDITQERCTTARSEADAMPSTNGIEREMRDKAIARAQGMAKVASKN